MPSTSTPTTVEVGPGPDARAAIEAWRQPPGVRTRTATWQDPRDGALHALERSGLEYLEAIASGELAPPPIAILLGFAMTELGDGEAVFETEPGEHQYNPIGTVHGGMVATLLDSAMGCAVQTTLPAGVGYTTTDVQVRFVRPVTAEVGRLYCRGRVVHRGRRVATAEGDLVDQAGKLYAHASTSCLLFELEDVVAQVS